MLRDMLREVDCFKGLDDTTLALLAEHMREVKFSEGELICEENSPADWMFIIASGEVRVVKDMGEGPPVQVAVLRPGEFGGIQSLFESRPRSATLLAHKPTALWVLDHATFRSQIRANSDMAMAMLAFMSKRMRTDSQALAVTLNYVERTGLIEVYERCSPGERLILDGIITKVMVEESLEGIMDFLFNALRRIGQCDRLGLAFLEDEGGRVVSYWTIADYEPLLLDKGYARELKGSSLEKVLQSGKPRIINDLEEYAATHRASEPSRMLVEEGIRSSMACPLLVEGRPVGFLFRGARNRNAYDDHQVQLHMAIADRLSQVVEKAYRIEQLTAANRAYFEMLGFVSHELKSPLSSIVMCADVLLGGYLGEVTAEQRGQIERIVGKSKYLLDLIGEYLNLSRLEGGYLEPNFRADVDFHKEVVQPSIDIVMPQVQNKGMNLEHIFHGEAAQAECAPELLQIVMVNLLSNAAKYGNDGGVIRVDIGGDETNLTASVWNEGPGFPKEEQSKLFRKFSRIQTPELLQRKGTGVGLYTTWRIIQSHNGTIKADSELGRWAEFSFRIPQPIGG